MIYNSMKKIKPVILLICLMAIATSANAQQLVGSVDLLNNTFSYDNKQIIYVGEVVGIMKRGNFAWVNVHDGSYAIGVWTPVDYIKDIKMTGDYDHKGDIIEVTGTFHRADTEHGGDLDIHASSIKIIEKGYEVKHYISVAKIIFAVLLGLLVILLVWINSRIR